MNKKEEQLQLLMYRARFKNLYLTLEDSKVKSWEEKREELEKEGEKLHPFQWIYLLEIHINPKQAYHYSVVEDHFLEMLGIDFHPECSFMGMIGAIEEHIPGFTNKNLTQRMHMIYQKIKEYDRIEQEYDLEFESRNWYNSCG